MAAVGGTQSGRFHLKCSTDVRLSTDRTTAWTTRAYDFGIVFSKEPIPTGHKFSVRVLKPGAVSSSLYGSTVWDAFLGIGVTTDNPISLPVLEKLDEFKKAHQYWYVKIDSPDGAVQHKGQQGRLPWTLASSEGKTAGCWVSDKGTFYVCTGESDSGDVMGKGLPTGKPLWGFLAFQGPWQVEANYKVAIPKGHPQLAAPAIHPNSCSPAVQPRPKAPAGHPQDYAGKTFHFVEKPPEWLVCAVCHALAHDPVQAKCCGKIYCSRCIEKWKTKSDSCPTCRRTEQSEPPFNVSEDKNARQQIISLTVYCPKWKEGCDKKMELSEVESHFTSNNCFLFQPVECEYNRFGCAIVLSRKDMAEHLKTSMEAHLQMTKRRVQEQEVRLQEERQLLEVQLRKMEEMAKKHETRLKDVEERAERERQRLKEAIARKVEQMEKRAKMQETGLKDVEERAEKERKIMNEAIARKVEQMEKRAKMQETGLKDVEERAEKERKIMNEAIARKVEQMEKRAKMHETRLKDVEESAERERQKLKEAIARNVEEMKERAKMQETYFTDAEESKLMKEKMHRTTTLMRWLLICVPVLLLVATFIGYHQGLLPPVTAIILSYLLGLFSLIHYHVL